MGSVTSGGSLHSSGGEADDLAPADSLSAIFQHSSGATSPAVVPLPPSLDRHHHSRRFFDPISYLDSISSISQPTWQPPSPPPRFPLSSPPVATSVSVSLPLVQPAAAPGGGGPPRSSKKRSRASRRVQTTVLTTDTSNFRAMVQQFTGIPSLPFDLAGAGAASSSPFARSRFGLFRPSSFSPLASPPLLLLRPFPLKTSAAVAAASPAAAYSSSSSPPSATAGIAAASSAISGDRSASTTQSPMLTLQSLLHDMPAFFSAAKTTTETPTELGSSELCSPAPRAEISAGSQEGASSCKMIYLAPPALSTSPELNAENELASPAPAPAPSKGEDIIDSWISSSD